MKFIKKGILTTYLDQGKNGLRHLGVNPAGAMDKYTVKLLNILLQKEETEPVIEMHFPAPEIFFEEDCTIIIGGANFTPTIDNQLISNWKAVEVKAISVLKFNQKVTGNRAYLAVTNQKNKLFLPYLGNMGQVTNLSVMPEIRFIQGNEFDLLTPKSKLNMENQSFMIAQHSNRMGYRMKSQPLELGEKKELVSAAVDFGTMQLLPDGQIIVLMADHQTSGGYPRIGNVISTDLPKLAQLGPNDSIQFKQITIEEAEDLIMSEDKQLQKLKSSIKFFNEKNQIY